jgi:fumarate hydratase class I
MDVKFLNTEKIYKAVYALCERANVHLPHEVFKKLADFPHKNREQILQNAHLAAKKCRPLCQDTGQVVVFLDVGQEVALTGEWVEAAINRAVSDCYRDKFYRKSIVADALERENTKDNTPAIIHTRIVEGAQVEILVALKGGGAENTSKVKMFNPTATREEIFDFVRQTADECGENACPPMSLGVAIGGTLEQACLLAKRALYFGNDLDFAHENVFEAKILTSSTHIASMPVCVNTNCHCDRYASCSIIDGKIVFNFKEYQTPPVELNFDAQKLKTTDIESLKALNVGDKIFLSGTIYTARDAAHEKMAQMLAAGEKLPIELENIIIFYAGPCPAAPEEVIGPIGPTTSKRMDKFARIMCDAGALGAIGKGERTARAGLYFKLTGGVACLVQDCIKKAEVVAFQDLGTEAVYRLEVENLPLELSY